MQINEWEQASIARKTAGWLMLAALGAATGCSPINVHELKEDVGVQEDVVVSDTSALPDTDLDGASKDTSVDTGTDAVPDSGGDSLPDSVADAGADTAPDPGADMVPDTTPDGSDTADVGTELPNNPPTAGVSYLVGPPAAGVVVTLDATTSTDPDGDPLTYTWALSLVPTGSQAVLQVTTGPAVGFAVDLPGTYGITLTADDGELTSTADQLILVEFDVPTAFVSGPQTGRVGCGVPLGAAASQPLQDETITDFEWAVTDHPEGATPVIDDDGETAVIDGDIAGMYTVQLQVTDSSGTKSLPNTKTVVLEPTDVLFSLATSQLSTLWGVSNNGLTRMTFEPGPGNITRMWMDEYTWSSPEAPLPWDAGTAQLQSEFTTIQGDATYLPAENGSFTKFMPQCMHESEPQSWVDGAENIDLSVLPGVGFSGPTRDFPNARTVERFSTFPEYSYPFFAVVDPQHGFLMFSPGLAVIYSDAASSLDWQPPAWERSMPSIVGGLEDGPSKWEGIEPVGLSEPRIWASSGVEADLRRAFLANNGTSLFLRWDEYGAPVAERYVMALFASPEEAEFSAVADWPKPATPSGDVVIQVLSAGPGFWEGFVYQWDVVVNDYVLVADSLAGLSTDDGMEILIPTDVGSPTLAESFGQRYVAAAACDTPSGPCSEVSRMPFVISAE